MADLAKDNDSASAEKIAVSQQEDVKKAPVIEHSRTFLDARSEEEVLSGIKREVEAGRLPPNVADGMKEFFLNYRNAVKESGIPQADEVALSNASVCLDRILLDVEEPFVFPPYHKALREPFDYYTFGQNYIRPLINFKNSYFGNITIMDEIKEKIQQGHNVVLMSNHQSEADPAVIGLLLELTHESIAANMTYVAGDRVVTDPLCKPFSMGRNLICVYSKKHMYDVPELAETKKKANLRSLKEMALLLRGGSQVLWIAPSGGRDRPDPITGEWHPAPFDSSSVENMTRLVKSSGVPGHIYPLALHCYDIMPPPTQVEKEIGEKRVIGYHGVGLSIKPAIDFNEACSEVLYEAVREQYEVLKSAIQGQEGLALAASTPTISLSQPWNH